MMPTRTGAQASEDRSHRLVEALGVAVYMTDAAGRITDYNEAAVELWGRRPELGKDEWCGSWRLYWPDGTPMPHDQCPLALTLKEDRPIRGSEAIAERPDGSRVCFIPYPTPIHDDLGSLVGAVNVLVDITKRKLAEQALNENQVHLTEALAAKDAFLGLVSHELRTPMTTILGNAEILTRRSGMLDETALRAIATDIHGEAVRLNRIVGDLLTLARLEGEQLECEPVALNRVVERLVREYKRRSPRTIIVHDEAEELIVLGEENLIFQVLLNYLSNAEKYSPANTAINIAIECVGREAHVSVLDRGIGVRPEEVDRLFEPFYRSQEVRSTSGLGIGLSVCRRVAEAFGGRVWTVSRDGGGSEFGFALPLYDGSQGLIRIANSPRLARGATNQIHGNPGLPP